MLVVSLVIEKYLTALLQTSCGYIYIVNYLIYIYILLPYNTVIYFVKTSTCIKNLDAPVPAKRANEGSRTPVTLILALYGTE